MSQPTEKTLSIEQWCSLAASPGDPLPPVWIHVVSGSMMPLIRPRRDRMLLAAVPLETLKSGDIVLFPAKRLTGNYCLHRILRTRGELVQTMGDACFRPDCWFPRNKILGKVLLIRRGNRVIDCKNFLYRAFSRLWVSCRCFRRPLFLAFSVGRRIKKSCGF